MPSTTYSFSFTVEPNPACWSGLSSHFELRLMQPLPIYALEQLRQRFLYSVTTNHDPAKGARAIAQMAFETEIGTVLTKLVQLPPDVFTSIVCERRRYIDIDTDMASYDFLYGPSFDAIRDEGFLPESYVRLFQAHLDKPYAKYRMCAVAALLCISTYYLVAEVTAAVKQTAADTVGVVDAAVAVPGFLSAAGDTLTTADAVNMTRTLARTFSDAVAPTDAVNVAPSQHSFADAVAVADAVIVAPTEHTFADSVSTVDVVTKGFGYTKTISDTVTTTDAHA